MPRSLRSLPLMLGALFLATCLSVSGIFAQPQQRKRFGSPGTVELGGSMTFAATQPVTQGKTGTWVYDFSMAPYVGYFLFEGLELGINPVGLDVISVGDQTSTQIRMLFAPSYNFHTGTMVTPFLEGLAGITSASQKLSTGTATESGFTFGGRAGIKVALVEKGMLVIGIQYLQVTLDPSGASTRYGSNELSFSAGWTVWL
ncbi:MAG TPA: hypothetical protein VMF59_03540 [Bacteroidota bacterium]|nr:hypothetical protein [Bacteroidota bacterium]